MFSLLSPAPKQTMKPHLSQVLQGDCLWVLEIWRWKAVHIWRVYWWASWRPAARSSWKLWIRGDAHPFSLLAGNVDQSVSENSGPFLTCSSKHQSCFSKIWPKSFWKELICVFGARQVWDHVIQKWNRCFNKRKFITWMPNFALNLDILSFIYKIFEFQQETPNSVGEWEDIARCCKSWWWWWWRS